MDYHKSSGRLVFCIMAALLLAPIADAQTTKVATEYLMTLYAPLDAGQRSTHRSKSTMSGQIAPTMQTSAKRYDWLNDVQCVGKMVKNKNDPHVKYEIVIVR